jgi:hypothetical protein
VFVYLRSSAWGRHADGVPFQILAEGDGLVSTVKGETAYFESECSCASGIRPGCGGSTPGGNPFVMK